MTPKLRPTQLATLRHLNNTSNNEHMASESMLDIGLHIGRSVSSVRNAIDRMEASGHLKKIRNGKPTAKGVYLLTQLGLETLERRGIQKAHNQTGVKPLPDTFRSPAIGVAGQLHQAAPKGVGLTLKQVLGLGVVRSAGTVIKHARALSGLPYPLITVSPDPTVNNGRKVYTFHELTDEAEQVNLDYLQGIPGAEPKTYAQHEEENERKKQGYAHYLGGAVDMEYLYETQVKPLIVTSPEHLGCEIFTGEIGNKGYGIVRHGRVFMAAHRVSWVAQCGEEQPGTHLHHWCGVPRCTTIHHLNPVSPADHRAIHKGEPCRAIIPSLWRKEEEPQAA